MKELKAKTWFQNLSNDNPKEATICAVRVYQGEEVTYVEDSLPEEVIYRVDMIVEAEAQGPSEGDRQASQASASRQAPIDRSRPPDWR